MTGCFSIILFVYIMNNILPRIFGNSTKSTNWKYNIKCMTKILIRLYIVIFISLMSIYNFSLSFILTFLIIILINTKISNFWSFIISFFKFTIFEHQHFHNYSTYRTLRASDLHATDFIPQLCCQTFNTPGSYSSVLSSIIPFKEDASPAIP